MDPKFKAKYMMQAHAIGYGLQDLMKVSYEMETDEPALLVADCRFQVLDDQAVDRSTRTMPQLEDVCNAAVELISKSNTDQLKLLQGDERQDELALVGKGVVISFMEGGEQVWHKGTVAGMVPPGTTSDGTLTACFTVKYDDGEER